MKVKYDNVVDAAYLCLKDTEIAASEVAISKEVEPGIVYDFNESNDLIGMEILSIRNRPFEEIKRITSELTEEQKEEFRKFYQQSAV